MTSQEFLNKLGKGPGFTLAYLTTLAVSARLLATYHLSGDVFVQIVNFTTATFFAGGIGKAVGTAWGRSNGSSKASGKSSR